MKHTFRVTKNRDTKRKWINRKKEILIKEWISWHKGNSLKKLWKSIQLIWWRCKTHKKQKNKAKQLVKSKRQSKKEQKAENISNCLNNSKNSRKSKVKSKKTKSKSECSKQRKINWKRCKIKSFRRFFNQKSIPTYKSIPLKG